MLQPQPAIFSNDNAPFHHYLEFKLINISDMTSLILALKQIQTLEFCETIMAFGPQAWRTLSNDVPDQLYDFKDIIGSTHQALSTQADLFFWISSHSEQGQSLVYDQAYAISQILASIATIQLDQPAFLYHQSRDLIGFEDGSANPKDEQRYDIALIAEGNIGAGGSFLLTQKWVHQLETFNQLETEQQEKIIGRTKKDSIELSSDVMPKDSHVSRTDVSIDGEALKVFRCSKPFGNTQEKGLYFVSFASELRRHQIQLERMYGVSNDGIEDKLLSYSRAHTSSYWFVPSLKDLQQALS